MAPKWLVGRADNYVIQCDGEKGDEDSTTRDSFNDGNGTNGECEMKSAMHLV